MASTKHQPTERSRGKVEALAAYGQTEKQIAIAVGIGERTLRKYYKPELAASHDALNARMAQTLSDIALGRDVKEGEKHDKRAQVTALLFWLKTRAGWRETNNLDLKGIPEGGTPVVVVLPDNGRDS